MASHPPPVAPDRYWAKCKRIDYERIENQCSVDGCVFCKHCTTCDAFELGLSDSEPSACYNNSDHEDEICYQQMLCRESPFRLFETGYLRCWICSTRFCKEHFVRHYKSCRFVASHRCGFRPPTQSNGGQCFVCVPGHCGKKIERQIGHRDDYKTACWQDNCSTTCCGECGSVCDKPGLKRPYEMCGAIRCKLHTTCDGSCRDY